MLIIFLYCWCSRKKDGFLVVRSHTALMHGPPTGHGMSQPHNVRVGAAPRHQTLPYFRAIPFEETAMLENSHVFGFYLVATLCVVLFVAPRSDAARPFFVFGDSLVDNGNNNYLATTARADAAPYGIDYPTHRATGQFSNGFNIPDLISQELGAETTLPYLSPLLNGERLLNGANFASAGIGILNDTGIQFVYRIWWSSSS